MLVKQQVLAMMTESLEDAYLRASPWIDQTMEDDEYKEKVVKAFNKLRKLNEHYQTHWQRSRK